MRSKTATIRDSSTASGKLGNLKELLQKAAIGTSKTYRVLLPAYPTPGTLTRTYIVYFTRPQYHTQVPREKIFSRKWTQMSEAVDNPAPLDLGMLEVD